MILLFFIKLLAPAPIAQDANLMLEAKSQQLSNFIDALSSDRPSVHNKIGALARVWRPGSN